MTPLFPTPVWLLLGFLAPGLGALVGLVAPVRFAAAIARGAALVALAAAVVLLASASLGEWYGVLGVDALSEVFLVLIAGVYATATWYSAGYLSDVRERFLGERAYYGLFGAFAAAMLFTASVSDLGLMWIGVEATTVASALLIVLERKATSVEAAWRYTLIASAGLTLALLALVVLYQDTGTLDLFRLARDPPPFSLSVALVVGLALVGYGTKVGLFPMHTWLPDAHSEAPSPVSALFSGVLLPTALYAFLRVDAIVPGGGPLFLRLLVVTFGLATALVAALLLQRQRSYKRLLAYSSMENMGLALVGVGIGGIGLYAALLLVFAHGFAKSSAFYCAGNVLRTTGTNRIAEIRDLRHRMPWTSAAWVLSSLAVTGAPPFGTFVAELLLVVAAVAAGWPLVAVALLVAILLAFLGLNHQVGTMVFDVAPPTGTAAPSPPPRPSEPLGGAAVAFVNLGVALALGLLAIPYLAPALHAGARLLAGGGP